MPDLRGARAAPAAAFVLPEAPSIVGDTASGEFEIS
jgi:hypothetical protein